MVKVYEKALRSIEDELFAEQLVPLNLFFKFC